MTPVSKVTIEVLEVGEWEPAGRYVMGRWQREVHTDRERHERKTHDVYRTRDFKAKFMAEKQLARIAAQREARNGDTSKKQGQKNLAKEAVNARSRVQTVPSEYGAGHLDLRSKA